MYNFLRNLWQLAIINKKKIIFCIILVACFAGVFTLGIWLGSAKFTYCVNQPGTMNFSLFWDAYNKLNQYFVDPNKIDSQKIIYGAVEGMTETLGDPYTAFFDPEQARKFQQDLSGSFEGIGVEIGLKQDRLTIVAPIDNSPGQKAGLKPGDIILKIDSKDASGMSTDEAVNLIRGPKGTNVTLTIYRTSWQDSKDIKITRDTIKISPITLKIKDNNVAYIKISQFDDSLASDFAKLANEILSGPAKKIVLDLRNNPGGYLEVSQDIAGWFLEKGRTVTIEDFGKDKEQKIYKAEGSSSFAEYPIVVLINEGSASASEILAGALRDNRNIKLIGTKSFGKGSVQQVVDLNGGAFLKITIAKWLTPKGNSISDVGLDPDVKIEKTDDDIKEDRDPQLDKALEIIKNIK